MLLECGPRVDVPGLLSLRSMFVSCCLSGQCYWTAVPNAYTLIGTARSVARDLVKALPVKLKIIQSTSSVSRTVTVVAAGLDLLAKQN